MHEDSQYTYMYNIQHVYCTVYLGPAVGTVGVNRIIALFCLWHYVNR